MNSTIQVEEIFQKYEPLCQELYKVLLEENSQLKRSGSDISPELLEKKKELLEHFDYFTQALKEIEKAKGTDRQMVARLQNKLTKVLYLNQENEKLYLQSGTNEPVRGSFQPAGASAKSVANAYKKAH